MVSYRNMTDKEIEDYREKQKEYDKQRQKEWEESHPHGVESARATPFDRSHSIPLING